MLTRKFILGVVAALPVLLGCMSEDAAGTTSTSDEIGYPVPPTFTAAPTIPQTAKKSPLAQLMRDITAHADSVRAALKRSDELPPYPQEVSEMLTATATDSTLDRTVYSILANDYLTKLKSLYAAPATDRTRTYNAVVQTCATCHGSLCPGPLVLIRKMYAPVPTKAP